MNGSNQFFVKFALIHENVHTFAGCALHELRSFLYRKQDDTQRGGTTILRGTFAVPIGLGNSSDLDQARGPAWQSSWNQSSPRIAYACATPSAPQ